MQSTQEHLILLRCSDGRIKVPEAFNQYIVHPISMAGGAIAPELSSVTNKGEDKTLEVLMWNIEMMVGLKKPTRIVLAAHSYCGAAGLVGMNDEELKAANLAFALKLGKLYPQIRVTVFFDKHSECGRFHHEPPEFRDSFSENSMVSA